MAIVVEVTLRASALSVEALSDRPNRAEARTPRGARTVGAARVLRGGSARASRNLIGF